MAYTAKEYQGAAAASTLSADITNAATTFSAVAATGYPTGSAGNFVIVLDRGKSTEEKILCSSRTGTAFTVATSGRGYDGTTAVAHTAGAVLEHCLTAVDLSEANTAVVQTVGKVTSVGDLLVGTGPNALARLGVGSGTQVLGVSGGTPAWVTGGAVLSTTLANIADVTNTKVLGVLTTAAPADHAHSEGMSGVLTWMSL